MGRGPRNPGCTCCDTDCLTFSDDFNRSDDTDIGSDWTEATGDWSISSNALTVATTSAVVTCDTTQSGDQTAWVALSADTLGDKVRVIMSYVDSSNYIAIEIEAGDHYDAIRVFVNNGAGESQQGDTQYGYYTGAADGTLRDIYCCLDKTADTIRWSSMESHNSRMGAGLVNLGTYPDGSTVGLGTGDTLTGSIEFDDFNLGRRQDAYSFDKRCIQCESCMIYGEAFDSFVDTSWETSPDQSGKINGLTVSSGSAARWSIVTIGDSHLRYDPGAAQTDRILTKYGSPESETESIVFLSAVFGDGTAADGGGVDDEIRMIVNAVDDDNFHYADIINSATGSVRVRLGKRTSGTDTDLTTTSSIRLPHVRTSGVFDAYSLCLANGVLAFSVSDAVSEAGVPLGGVVQGESERPFYLQAATTAHASGCKVGFGATTTGTDVLTFEDFAWFRHHINDSRCYRCCGEGMSTGHVLCNGNVMSSFVQLEVTGTTSYDGTYILHAGFSTPIWRFSGVDIVSAGAFWMQANLTIYDPPQVFHNLLTGQSTTATLSVSVGNTATENYLFVANRSQYQCSDFDLSLSDWYGSGASIRISSIGDCGSH